MTHDGTMRPPIGDGTMRPPKQPRQHIASDGPTLAELPCPHRGELIGQYQCGCNGRPSAFLCDSQDNPSGLAIWPNRPIKKNVIYRPDGTTWDFTGKPQSCSACRWRLHERDFLQVLHIVPRAGWQDVVRRSAFAMRSAGVKCCPVEAVASDRDQVIRAVPQCEVVVMHGLSFPVAQFLQIVTRSPDVRFFAVDHCSANHLATWPQHLTTKRELLEATKRLENLTVCCPDQHQTWDGYRFAHWPNPVYLPDFQQPPTIDPPCIAISSRADVVKAIPAQLAAAARLQRTRGVDVLVSLGGRGNAVTALRRYSEALGLRAEWLPYATPDAWLERLRTRVSVLLQPSMSESFNYASLDAASMGRPFVGSRAIRHTPSQWLVLDPNDPEEIAIVAGEILDDYPAASTAARHLAEHIAQRNNAAYAALIGGGA